MPELRRHRQRQEHVEGGPLIGAGVGPDASTVVFDDAAHQLRVTLGHPAQGEESGLHLALGQHGREVTPHPRRFLGVPVAAGDDSRFGNATKIQGRDVVATAPTDGQVLKWINANNRWEPAADGGSGVLAFKNNQPDLVILDRDLPVMTGSAVLQKIRRQHKK